LNALCDDLLVEQSDWLLHLMEHFIFDFIFMQFFLEGDSLLAFDEFVPSVYIQLAIFVAFLLHKQLGLINLIEKVINQ
jgi:hypothetical protein